MTIVVSEELRSWSMLETGRDDAAVLVRVVVDDGDGFGAGYGVGGTRASEGTSIKLEYCCTFQNKESK